MLRRLFCDLAGARTQDPLLKREMLYQLSYQVKILMCLEQESNLHDQRSYAPQAYASTNSAT